MRRFSFVSLICLAFFSFLSCAAEVSSYSSVSVTVIPPQDNSEHGYIQSDLESCKLELFTSSNGKSALYAVDFNKPLYLSDLNSGSLTVRAYGYDSSATAIALSEIEVFNLDDDASLSKKLTLTWYEKGKGEDEFCYVKFDTDGGSNVAQQKVKSGSQVTLPPSPVKAGYTFSGWYWNSSRTVEFDFSQAITWNLTLHAKWESGGSTDSENTGNSSNSGDSGSGSENTPGSSGDSGNEPGNTSGSDSDIEDIITVTYYQNDGSENNLFRTITQKKGETHWIQGLNMVEERTDGYYFLGWANTPNATSPDYITEFNIDNVTQDISLYAVWTQDYFTFTLINTYTSGETYSKKLGKGSNVFIPQLLDNNPFTHPEGYINIEAAPNTNPAYEDFINNVEVTEDKTFYIFWSFWLVFHEGHNDSDGNEFTNWQRNIYGKEIESYTPNREGYTFIGWYADEQLTQAIDFSNLSSLARDENEQLHIYANWEQKANASGITIEMESLSTDEQLNLTLTGNTFTAKSGFSSYLWKLDGSKVNVTGNSFTVTTSTLEEGIHNVTLVVTDSKGNRYSARSTIKTRS